MATSRTSGVQAVSAMAEAHKLKLRQKFVKPTAAGYNKKPPVEKKSVALPPKKKSVSVVSTGVTNVVKPEPASKVEDNIDYIAKLLLMKLNQAKAIEREDVDAENRDNPFYCTEYVKEIFCYLRELERTLAPEIDYMAIRQTELNAKMRCVLVDWLVLVHQKFKLLSETLYLTVSIMDRYFSICAATKSTVQLVAITAMLIASKYEEIYAPQITEFVHISLHTYTQEEVRHMEREMLKVVDYRLGAPSPLQFLRRLSKIVKVSPKMHTMAKFLMELCLQDYAMLQYLPSQQAAAALYLSIRIYDTKDWTARTEFHAGYTREELAPCVKKMAEILLNAPQSKQQAVRDKYSNKQFMAVAKHFNLVKSAADILAH